MEIPQEVVRIRFAEPRPPTQYYIPTLIMYFTIQRKRVRFFRLVCFVTRASAAARGKTAKHISCMQKMLHFQGILRSINISARARRTITIYPRNVCPLCSEYAQSFSRISLLGEIAVNLPSLVATDEVFNVNTQA